MEAKQGEFGLQWLVLPLILCVILTRECENCTFRTHSLHSVSLSYNQPNHNFPAGFSCTTWHNARHPHVVKIRYHIQPDTAFYNMHHGTVLLFIPHTVACKTYCKPTTGKLNCSATIHTNTSANLQVSLQPTQQSSFWISTREYLNHQTVRVTQPRAGAVFSLLSRHRADSTSGICWASVEPSLSFKVQWIHSEVILQQMKGTIHPRASWKRD